MKVALNTVILQLDGTPFKREDGEEATLNHILISAVNQPVEEKGESLYQVAVRIALADGEIDLTSEDITALKARVKQIYPNPVLVGRVCDMLEGKEVELPKPRILEKKEA